MKQLRTSLEASLKETNSHKREKNDLELQITQLKREMDKIHMLMMKHAGQFNRGYDLVHTQFIVGRSENFFFVSLVMELKNRSGTLGIMARPTFHRMD